MTQKQNYVTFQTDELKIKGPMRISAKMKILYIYVHIHTYVCVYILLVGDAWGEYVTDDACMNTKPWALSWQRIPFNIETNGLLVDIPPWLAYSKSFGSSSLFPSSTMIERTDCFLPNASGTYHDFGSSGYEFLATTHTIRVEKTRTRHNKARSRARLVCVSARGDVFM